MPAPYWTPKADRLAAVIDAETAFEILEASVPELTKLDRDLIKFDLLQEAVKS